MVKTLWLVRKLGDFNSDLVGEDDIVVLVQDAVLRFPYKKNWYVCKEDVEGRGLKVSPDKLKSYEDIAGLIFMAQRVVVW